MIYTGIGSRQTPDDILVIMTAMAVTLAQDGHTLRSGGAPGADLAFERGVDSVEGSKEIYLPWWGFNDEQRGDCRPDGIFVMDTEEAYNVGARYHPAWGRLKQGARMLMARNSHQVLGADLATPTDLVICWTEGGKGGGGTGQALRIAHDHDIAVVDMGQFEDIAYAVDEIGNLVELLTIFTQ